MKALLHLLLFFFVATMPLWPMCILQYVYVIPLFVELTRLVCNGCPLNRIQGAEIESLFPQTISKHFGYIHCVSMTLVPTVYSFRLQTGY
jgi:hypothetical protein